MHTTDFTQLDLDQLNNRTDLTNQQKPLNTDAQHTRRRQYDIMSLGDVLNYTFKAMKLTRGRLLKLDDWDNWHKSEFL